MQLEGKLLIRKDGVRLLLSPYRQQLAGGKGANKRVQAQVQALSKETGLTFGTVRTLRDGTSEALLGAEHDCYPAGELVLEQLGAPERLFFAEEIGADRFVVIAVEDRRVVMDEVAHSEQDLLAQFEVATHQFGDRHYTLAVSQSIYDGLPGRGIANPQILDASVIESAVVLSALKFRAVNQIASSEVSPRTKRMAITAAVVAALGAGGWYYYSGLQAEAFAEEQALLASLKNRALDPLADYKRQLDTIAADAFINKIGTLIDQASSGRGWIPSKVEYENGLPLKIAFTSFGGTRTQLVSDVRIPGAAYGQGPEGTLLLIDLSGEAHRAQVPQLQPLSKSIFETLDALEANSMGVLKVQVGEIATFGRWSSQKVQINVESAPLPLITLISKSLEGRAINVTQAELSLENQALSGVIHLDVFGS